MNNERETDLIDDQDLLDALQPMRPDRDVFEEGVRRRIEAAQPLQEQSPSRIFQQPHSSDESPWLQVAASVIPFPLLGKVAGGSASISAGKVSLGYKLVGYLALPAIGLFLAIGATVFGLFRIRQAQQSLQNDKPEAIEIAKVTAHWWRQYFVMTIVFYVVSLALLFVGWAMPLCIAFLCSGIAMVSLVTRLGRVGLIDRQVISGYIFIGLMSVAHFPTWGTDSQLYLLDQSLVAASIYIAMALLVILFGGFGAASHSKIQRENSYYAAIPILFLAGLQSNSLWCPITNATMKHYVESFDRARFHSVSWKHWETPAGWLRESRISFDQTKPRKLLEVEIAGEQNPYIMGIAFDIGLIEPNDLPRLRIVESEMTRLLDPKLRNKPISSVEIYGYAILAHMMADRLSDIDRDHLESRLLATLRNVEHSRFEGIESALAATKLLEAIDRRCMDNSIRESVQRLLKDSQCVSSTIGRRQAGGFSKSKKPDFSDEPATAAAIELMQRYGVPPKLDLIALRSYLRPSRSDRMLIKEGVVRTAIRQRLESLPDTPALTLWDYIRYESNLWMSLMVVLLCYCAILGCKEKRVSV